MTGTPPKPPQTKIIKKALKAVSGKPVCDPNAPCQPCRRSDLQLLVVIPSVVPAEHANALKDAGYAWAPSFDAAFGLVKREATVPVARVMREGYVYQYYVQQKLLGCVASHAERIDPQDHAPGR